MEFSDATEAAPTAEPEVSASPESTESPEAPQATEPPTMRRGRPRSEETIQRDETVLRTLTEHARTKEQLAQDLGLKDTHVYLSLWRLRRDGKVEKVTDGDVRHLWRARV